MRRLLSLPILNALGRVFAPADKHGSGESGPAAQMPAELNEYRWRNRLILLFAASAEDPAYTEQRDVLEAVTEGLLERHVVVLSDTDPEAAGALRTRFKPQGFEVLLIGKDGGVKLRQRQPVAAETLFATIDAMPMRRREMDKQAPLSIR